MMTSSRFSCPEVAGKGPGNSRGFSLVEVLVAMLLVGASVAVILEGYGTALKSNQKAFERIAEAELYEQAVQEVRVAVELGRTEGEFVVDGLPVNWRILTTDSRKKYTVPDPSGAPRPPGQDIHLSRVELTLGSSATEVNVLWWGE